jgi:formate dehydrogenase iron-sulfur subunit
MSLAILYDSTQCVGCRECERACSARWGLKYDDSIGATERLSERKLTTVESHGERYVRRMCMHCLESTCVSVCPVAALQKTRTGPVVYDEKRCIGCRYCMVACPFRVPVYEWSRTLPRIKKCNLCFERLQAGKPTACSEACPTGATITGRREDLIREARRRLAQPRGEYHDSIYGLREAGGTSVLVIAGVPPEQLGLPAGLPQEPLPMLTWRALSFVPDVAGVGAVLLGGVYWITHRREEVEAAEGGGKPRKEGRK